MSRERPDLRSKVRELISNGGVDLSYGDAASLYQEALTTQVQRMGAEIGSFNVTVGRSASGSYMTYEIGIKHPEGNFVISTKVTNDKHQRGRVSTTSPKVTGGNLIKRMVVGREAKKILNDPEGNLAKSIGLDGQGLNIFIHRNGVRVELDN